MIILDLLLCASALFGQRKTTAK